MHNFFTKTFVFLIFNILITPGFYAQKNSAFFEEIGIKNGLSSNYPTSIIQDSKGFIWVGTNNGLNRYDGYQSKIFTYDTHNANSISDNWITCLLEDSNGLILYEGSQEATMGNSYQYRIKDIAAFYLSKITNIPIQFYQDFEKRDAEIERLKLLIKTE